MRRAMSVAASPFTVSSTGRMDSTEAPVAANFCSSSGLFTPKDDAEYFGYRITSPSIERLYQLRTSSTLLRSECPMPMPFARATMSTATVSEVRTWLRHVCRTAIWLSERQKSDNSTESTREMTGNNGGTHNTKPRSMATPAKMEASAGKYPNTDAPMTAVAAAQI